MTAKNIIKTACIFLQKDELLDVTDLDGELTATSTQLKELEHLLRCLNLVIDEIATDYVPLVHKEKLTPSKGIINLSSFSKDLIDILQVKDKFGIKANYKLFPSYLETIDGEVEVTYSFKPVALTSLSSTMEQFSQKVSERVVAYGVAMEYSFICGLHDDASIWEKRFKDGLIIASRKKSDIRLPKRGWI